MRWIDLLRMSIQSLKRRRLRTFLTVLGVVIGTASIVVMISIGFGMQQSLYEEIEQSGGMTGITVSSSSSNGGEQGGDQNGKKVYVTDESIKQIAELEHVRSAQPVISAWVILKSGKYTANVELKGMTPEGLKQLNIPISPGGRLPDPASAAFEVVYGNMILPHFGEENGGSSYWETGVLPSIDLMNDQMFMILDTDAYYNSKSTAASSADPSSPASKPKAAKKYVIKGSGLVEGGPEDYTSNSFTVFCDLDALRKMMKKEFAGRAIPGQPLNKNNKPLKQFVYSQIFVQADDVHQVEDVAKAIRELGYDVTTNAEYLKSIQREFAMVQAVLGGIGAISLIVAAIGIANTMMMSIYERTREIGVMKVIGCSLRNIRQLFLIEAGFIGLFGGIIGNVLSFLMSAVLNAVAGQGLSGGTLSYIPPWLSAASIVFALFVGMGAGYFPALRAMKLSPLAAIRNE